MAIAMPIGERPLIVFILDLRYSILAILENLDGSVVANDHLFHIFRAAAAIATTTSTVLTIRIIF